MIPKKAKIVVVLIAVSLSSVAFANFAFEVPSASDAVPQNPLTPNPPSGSFAFVSEFTSGGGYANYGWSVISGSSAPTITDTPNYYGEPSLNVTNGTTLFSNNNVTTGDQSVSFQFAIDASTGNGSFIITNASGGEVVSVSVWGNNVFVRSGGSPANGTAPAGLVTDSGWTLVTGNLFNYSGGNGTGWRLQVFVDKTISVFANISAPKGYSYGGIELSSSRGNVFFTNVIFSSYKMAVFLPGYNNMEGYGQGSGFIVNLLGPFTILHANFILYNWSVPRYSTLSFQINAMNLSAAENQTAKGFFQLGVDLDPNGKIAPWYVGGNNAIAIYFKNYASPDFMPGFVTPAGTVLGLTIQYLTLEKKVLFQIIDYNVSGKARYWNTTVRYSGPDFYSAYTQLETGSMGQADIAQYHFNGTMFNLTYGSDISAMTPFDNSYMLPFAVDTPSTWSLTYYSNNIYGYHQIG